MKDKPDSTDVECVMDNPGAPMVLWYPETKELEVRILDMLAATGFDPVNDEAFEALKVRIHDRIREAFECEDITTLMQARMLSFDLILKAAEKGELIDNGSASMRQKVKLLIEKQVLN